MKNWNKTKEDLRNEYELNVKLMATRFYYDRRDDTNTLLNDLYVRID